MEIQIWQAEGHLGQTASVAGRQNAKLKRLVEDTSLLEGELAES